MLELAIFAAICAYLFLVLRPRSQRPLPDAEEADDYARIKTRIVHWRGEMVIVESRFAGHEELEAAILSKIAGIERRRLAEITHGHHFDPLTLACSCGMTERTYRNVSPFDRRFDRFDWCPNGYVVDEYLEKFLDGEAVKL